MPAAAAIIKLVASEIAKQSIKEYFPEDVPTAQMQTSLNQINQTVADIYNDISMLAIQTYSLGLMENINYFKKTFMPFITREVKSDTLRPEELTRCIEKLRDGRIALDAKFESGINDFLIRLPSCDFTCRCLFSILQEIAALKLVFVSWEHFLRKTIGAINSNDLDIIQQAYKDDKADITQRLASQIEPLCDARLKMCSFEREVKRYVDNSLRHVKYDYRDTFYSRIKRDPFYGEQIHHHEDVEVSFYHVWAWGDAQKIRIANALDNINKFQKEYSEHRKKVMELNDLHIRQPAMKLVEETNKLPDSLQSVLPKLST